MFYSGYLKAIDQGFELLCNGLIKFFFGKENDRNDIIAAQHVPPTDSKNGTNVIRFNKILHRNDFTLFGICGFFGVLYKKIRAMSLLALISNPLSGFIIKFKFSPFFEAIV